MEAYSQQVALEQLKDENKDKARLAQKLAELEVLQLCTQVLEICTVGTLQSQLGLLSCSMYHDCHNFGLS